MTREERCWADLCKRLQRDPATSEESDTCTLRVAFKHALAFADAEAAAMRERAAGVADAYAKDAGWQRQLCTIDGNDESGEWNWGGRAQGARDLAAAIRALPATGEVGRG